MSIKPEKIQIQIKYKEIEQQFSADPQDAWLMVNQFFKDFIPSFEIAQKLWLSVDLQQLAKDLNGIVAFSSDGASLLAPKNKLQTRLGKSGKITSTRLGELAKNGVVQKTADDKFRITTCGVIQTQKEVIPKIKSKIKA